MRRLDAARQGAEAPALPASQRSSARWATLDCYGTLIDWNGGIGREVERLHAYHELEPQPDIELHSLAGPGESLDSLVS